MDQKIKEILVNDNFTIVNIIRLGKSKRNLFLLIVGLFVVGGLLYYSTTPKSYATMSVLLVETQQGGDAGGLGSLASVAGLGGSGFGSESSTLDPSLYPVILQSKPFLEELINSKVKSKLYPDSVSIFKYMVEVMPDNYIYKFLKRPLAVFDDPILIDDEARLSSRAEERIQYEPLELLVLFKISDRITYTSEGRILTIMVNMPEPELAFQFSRLVKSLLIDYSTEYLQEKQKGQVEYLELQHKKSEEGFKKAQSELTSFRERNQGLFLESQKAIEQNLNSDYNLKFDLYRTVTQELERAKIELNSQKPIFTSIEPPIIPNKPASPRFALTIAFSLALGLVFGMVAVFIYYIRAYFVLRSDS